MSVIYDGLRQETAEFVFIKTFKEVSVKIKRYNWDYLNQYMYCIINYYIVQGWSFFFGIDKTSLLGLFDQIYTIIVYNT